MGQAHLLLLGVSHLDNPGRDAHNVVVDDVLSPVRQAELAELGEALAAFRPTKVLVEAPRGHPHLDKYRRYLDGSHQLERNEIQQIGFRVASLCGLERVVGIDVSDEFWDPRIDELAQTDPKTKATLTALNQLGEAHVGEGQRVLAEGTMSDVLQAINSPAAVAQDLLPYLAYLPFIRTQEEFIGADVVANWYRRNLRIFAELLLEAAGGERLLVVFGAGHIPLLRHFAEGSGLFTIHEVADVLGAAD